MDDLDHSMCLAGDEWASFDEECEECALPPPPPASPDNWNLSDLEDSDSAAGHGGQESPAKADKVERSAPRGPGGGDGGLPGEDDDLPPAAEGDSGRSELCVDHSPIGTAGPSERAAASQLAEDDRAGDAGGADAGSEASSTDDPLSHRAGGDGDPTGKEPPGADGSSRTEKERWFVTVNDSPRERVGGAPPRKKRRPKQPRNSRRLPRPGGWARPEENGEKVQMASVRPNPDFSTSGHHLTSGRPDGDVYGSSCLASGGCGDTGPPRPDEPTDEGGSGSDDSDLPATETLREPPGGADALTGGEGRAPPPRSINEISDEGSEREEETGSSTSRPRTRDTNFPPGPGGSSGGRPGPAPTPVFTPCSPPDNPETRAVAAGHAPPVYAISAFWDDLEKTTINDILHLRMAHHKSSHPHLRRRLTDSKSADGAPPDSPDAADSDYFTQLDEPRPDHSGCNLSTSDLDEEHLRDAGRNSSPERLRAICSPYLSDEEGESTASEGMEAPVPGGPFAQTCLEDQERLDLRPHSSERAQRLLKSKSTGDVRALGLEDLQPRGEDESRPALCSPPNENTSGIPFLFNEGPSDNNTRTVSPEAFEAITGEDEAQGDSGSVLLYDPDPALDGSPLTFRDDILFTFLQYSQCSQKETIPIFSYSHPIIRTLTFPSYVFLNPACRMRHFNPPLGVVPGPPGIGGRAVPGELHHSSDFPVTKVSLYHKAGGWWRSSGAWTFPPDTAALRRAAPPAGVVTEGGAARTARQEESAERQTWEAMDVTSKSETS